jgi:hypothetical protein
MKKSEEKCIKHELLKKTMRMIYHELKELANPIQTLSTSRIELDREFIRRQKGIYETMNKYKLNNSNSN